MSDSKFHERIFMLLCSQFHYVRIALTALAASVMLSFKESVRK